MEKLYLIAFQQLMGPNLAAKMFFTKLLLIYDQQKRWFRKIETNFFYIFWCELCELHMRFDSLNFPRNIKSLAMFYFDILPKQEFFTRNSSKK